MNRLSRMALAGLAAITALLFAFTTAPAASALSTYTAGGTAQLSTNWTVKVSFTWRNTYCCAPRSGFAVGTTSYGVMNSPAPLDTTHSEVQFFNAQGENIGAHYRSWSGGYNSTLGRWVYRIDPPQTTGISSVEFDVYGGNGQGVEFLNAKA